MSVLKASLKYKADVVIRITGDCPLVDPEIVDNVLKLFKNNVDYCSNVLPPTFPDGMDVEVFSSSALYEANIKATKLKTKNITPFIRNFPNIQKNYEHKENFQN